MVLHNSKWDKRAKGRYLKKHGLSANDVRNSSTGNSDEHPKTAKVEESQLQEQQSEASQSSINAAQENQQEPELSTNIDLPEIEQDDDEDELIRAHRVRQGQQYLQQAQQQRESQETNSAERGKDSVFAQAEAGYERSKLNERVKKHIGRQAKQVDVDSDSDFDQFMDELSDLDEAEESAPKLEGTQKIEISGKQSELLDKLLG